MMGRQSGQMSMIILDLSELIPENHLLRKINQMISVDFIYDLEAPYYPANGRPSVDPVSMFKMLLVGYLYSVKSERRLVQEVQLNIVYRWFCGFELTDKIPDHSTFSKTRLRKWNESRLFQEVFWEIIRRCVKSGVVDGKELAADGTYLPANVSKDSWMETEVEAELICRAIWIAWMKNFLNSLVSKDLRSKRSESAALPVKLTQTAVVLITEKKSGIGYLMETTVDCKYGIITGVDVYPANEKKVCWFYGIWSGRFKTGSRCKTLHWIVATIPAPFIAVWNCWALQDIFLPFRFPILRKSMAFTIYPKKMHFVVRRAQNSFTNG